MKARDVMSSPVVTVLASTSVKDLARLMMTKGISGVPVVDAKGQLVGIVSEGDLLHRAEAGTEKRRSWWIKAFLTRDDLAADFVRSHSKSVADVMTRKVLTAGPEAPLHELATLLEKNRIKRVPIVHGDRLVGIVSRANLVQAVAANRTPLDVPVSDAVIRDSLMALLKKEMPGDTTMINAVVNDGVVDLWGFVSSQNERDAIRVAAESVSGVRAVTDNLAIRPIFPAI